MHIIHTADWHIGQNFFGYDRKEEHEAFFDWLRQQLIRTEADVLLICGDVFDGPNPSALSQNLYYSFLKEITTENPSLQVVIIAGNHDSAARLEAPAPLLEDRRIQIVGVVEKTLNGELNYKKMIIPLYENGVCKAWCLAVPYLRMGDLEIENKIEHNYSAAVENFYQKLLQVLNLEREKEEAVVMMGHLQATGSELLAGDRSERTIIGGLESVLPEAFDKDIAYVALGHLHKGQQVSGRNYVRYAGAPLPMSFAEKNFKQGVNLIELQNGKLQNIERLSFDSPVKLLSIPFKAAPWKEVLQELDQLPIIEKVGDEVSKYPFLEVKIWEEEPQPFMRSQIEAALRGKAVRLARITLERLCKEKQEMIVDLDNIQNIDPFTMASKVYMERYGVPMPESMANLMKIVIQEEQ